eukprot:scaffold6748_cov122-Isochrysis_galbana.AAC.12
MLTPSEPAPSTGLTTALKAELSVRVAALADRNSSTCSARWTSAWCAAGRPALRTASVCRNLLRRSCEWATSLPVGEEHAGLAADKAGLQLVSDGAHRRHRRVEVTCVLNGRHKLDRQAGRRVLLDLLGAAVGEDADDRPAAIEEELRQIGAGRDRVDDHHGLVGRHWKAEVRGREEGRGVRRGRVTSPDDVLGVKAPRAWARGPRTSIQGILVGLDELAFNQNTWGSVS